MNHVAMPKKIYSDWEVEFVGTIHDGMQDVDCVATVVLDYDGAAYEVSHASYFTPENVEITYEVSDSEAERLFTAAQKQYDRFMEEA